MPLGALLVVLAAGVGAASGVGGGSARLKAEPAAVTFTVAVTLVLVFLAACLAALVYGLYHQERTGRGRGGGTSKRSRYRILAPAILAAVLLGIAALLAHVRHRPQTHLLGGAGRLGGSAHHHASVLHFVAPASYATVGVVAAVLAVMIVVPIVQRALRQRRPFVDVSSPDLRFPEIASSPHGLARAVSAAAIADPAAEPDARRAVVACWLAMAGAGETAGERREPFETASEYLVRLLGLLGVSAPSAARLTSYFELARYSTAPIGEAVRVAAMTALAEVKTELRPA